MPEALIVKIVAHGQPLTLGLGAHVISFQYEDSEKEDDLFTVSFGDPYNELVDSDQFQEGVEWSVQWGFAGKLYPARKVIVKRPRFAYGQVEIQALDKGSELKLEEYWGTYQKTTPETIIEEIASAHGLKLEIDPLGFSTVPFMAQGGKTHYDVLKYLQSRAEDHFFKISGDILKFKKRNLNAPPVAQFSYAPGRDSRLVSFDIQIKDQDNAKSSMQTTAVTVDPFTHKTKTYSADEGSISTENLGNVRVTNNYKTSFQTSISKITGASIPHQSMSISTGKSLPLPPKNNDEMNSIVKGKRRASLLDNVEAAFEVSASSEDPFLESGDLIEVRGIGKKFSGMYQIITIGHDLTDGYKYSINAKRNAKGFTGETSASTPLLNGPINIKNSVKDVIQFVEKNIIGSISAATYGQTGRLLP